MTSSANHSRPLTEELIAAHPRDAVVRRGEQELTLGMVLDFEAAMCKASPDARNDEADRRFLARLLFDGGSLHEEFVHLVEIESEE